MDSVEGIRKLEEKKGLEKSQKQLLEKIKSNILAYNNLDCEKSLMLLELPKEDLLRYQVGAEKYVSRKQEVLEAKFNLCRDNLFVCIDDEGKVGLYQIVDLLKEEWLHLSLNAACLCMEEEKINFALIRKIESYQQLCKKMQKEGIAIIMDNSDIVTIKEINKVLAYAEGYFEIEKMKEKVKK